MHGRCAKNRRVTNRREIDSRCSKCKGCHENLEDKDEKLHDYVETVSDISCLGDGIYSRGGCDAAVTSRTRLGWARFND